MKKNILIVLEIFTIGIIYILSPKIVQALFWSQDSYMISATFKPDEIPIIPESTVGIINLGQMEGEGRQVHTTSNEIHYLETTPIIAVDQLIEILTELEVQIIETQAILGSSGEFGELIRRYLELPPRKILIEGTIEAGSEVVFDRLRNTKRIRFFISGEDWRLMGFLNIRYNQEMKISMIKNLSYHYEKYKEGNLIYDFDRYGDLIFSEHPQIHSKLSFHESVRFLTQAHNQFFVIEAYFNKGQTIPFKKTDGCMNYYLYPKPEYAIQLSTIKEEVLPPDAYPEFRNVVETLFSFPEFVYDATNKYWVTTAEIIRYDNRTEEYEEVNNYLFSQIEETGAGPVNKGFHFYSKRDRDGKIKLIATKYNNFLENRTKIMELNFTSRYYPQHIVFKLFESSKDPETGETIQLEKTILFNPDTSFYQELPEIVEWEY